MIKFTIPYPQIKQNKSAFCSEYGLNSIYSGKHWSKRKADKAYWYRLVLGELNRQGVPRTMFENPVKITFTWDDRLDCSNHAYMAKMIEDVLVGYVLHDDNRRWVIEIHHGFNMNGIIEVEVCECKVV